jgi:hypothetical protein
MLALRRCRPLVAQIAAHIGRMLEKRGLIERDVGNAWIAAVWRRVHRVRCTAS